MRTRPLVQFWTSGFLCMMCVVISNNQVRADDTGPDAELSVLEESSAEQPPVQPAAEAQLGEQLPEDLTIQVNHLDQLSDEELIDLYLVTYEESLRDSIVDQSGLVEPGRSLLQVGYSYTTQSDSGLRYDTHTLPEFLIRHRINKRMEVRAGWAGVTLDRLVDRPTGLSDSESFVLNPSLGLRYQLWRHAGLIPQVSITASTPVDLDTDTGFLRRLNPQIGAGYSWFVGDQWLISGSTGAIWNRGFDAAGDDKRFLDLQQSLSLDWLITERSSLYLQWVALFPEGLSGSHTIGPGFSMPVFNQTQLDLTTSFGLDDGAPDFGTQAFLSWRF